MNKHDWVLYLAGEDYNRYLCTICGLKHFRPAHLPADEVFHIDIECPCPSGGRTTRTPLPPPDPIKLIQEHIEKALQGLFLSSGKAPHTDEAVTVLSKAFEDAHDNLSPDDKKTLEEMKAWIIARLESGDLT